VFKKRKEKKRKEKSVELNGESNLPKRTVPSSGTFKNTSQMFELNS